MKPIVCLIAMGFIFASLYTTMTCDTCPPFNEYENSLDDEQLAIYEKIREERLNLYLRGLVVGIIVGSIYIYYYKDNFMTGITSCVFVAIIMTTQYFFYMLMPKSDYMLNHLRTNEQTRNYLKVGQHMQNRYYSGFLFGMIGYYLLPFSLLNN